jgi:transcriptional regulator with XRE-family HTH domain
MNKKGLNNADLARVCNLSQGATKNWKKEFNPNKKSIMRLANYFEVTTDYLLGLSDDPQQKNTNNEITYLSNNEKKLLDAFKQLDSITQNNLVEQAEFYVEKSLKTPKNKSTS